MKNWMYLERCWKLKPIGMLAYKLLNWKKVNLFVIQLFRESLSTNVLSVELYIILKLIGRCESSIEIGSILLAFSSD